MLTTLKCPVLERVATMIQCGRCCFHQGVSCFSIGEVQ